MSFRLNTTKYETTSNTTLNSAGTPEYQTIHAALVTYWSDKLGNTFISVTIILISKGSLIVDHTVQTRTDSTATVVTSANSLVSGTTTFTMGTEQVSAISANITYGNNEVQITKDPNPDLCGYYTTLSPCTSLQTCTISNGQPSCVNLNVSQHDNLPLIMGVSLGGVLLVITLALIFVLIAMHKRRKHRRELKSNSSSLIDHGIGMGLKYHPFQGDQSYYAGGPDFYNPMFMGGDAWSEMDYQQGHGHLRTNAGQNEFHIRRPQVDVDYNYYR